MPRPGRVSRDALSTTALVGMCRLVCIAIGVLTASATLAQSPEGLRDRATPNIAQSLERLPPTRPGEGPRAVGRRQTVGEAQTVAFQQRVPSAPAPLLSEEPGEPIPPPDIQEEVVGGVASGHASQYQLTQPAAVEIMPVDLITSWRLAARENPTIGLVRQVVQERLAILLRTRVIAVPNLNAGWNYHSHNGNLQRSSGVILNTPDEQSLYLGGGARTVAAETIGIPAVQIFAPVADAWYAPLAARQDVAASQFDVRATSNSILLQVTTRYLDLLGAQARFEALRRSELDMAEVVRTTLAFAEAGQGLESDANRAKADALLLRARVQAAEGEIAEASAALAQLLQLNPSIALRAPNALLAVITIVDPDETLDQLVATALQFRPEMGARSSEIAAAEVRFRQEQMRPLLPTITVGFSGGTFGGGSDLVTPLFGHFASRSDFDVVAYWTLQNLGAGNAGLRGRTRAVVQESTARRARMANQIRDEAATAYAETTAQWLAVGVSQRRLATAEPGFLNELRRARAKQGLPIEALNMVHLLVDAREALIRAVIEYDKAEFRLYVALGQPPETAIPLRPRKEVPGTGMFRPPVELN